MHVRFFSLVGLLVLLMLLFQQNFVPFSRGYGWNKFLLDDTQLAHHNQAQWQPGVYGWSASAHSSPATTAHDAAQPTYSSPSLPWLRYREHFSTTTYQAPVTSVDWNTQQQTLSLFQQDAVKQQAVVVTGWGAEYLYAVWQDLRNDDGDIYAQRFDANGNRLWSEDLRVNGDDGMDMQSSPAATVDQAGNLLVVWVDNRHGNNDIYAQRLDNAGNSTWLEDLRIHQDQESAAQDAPVVAFAGGDAFVAWHDNRRGDYDVYLQKVNSLGVTTWPADIQVNQDMSNASQTDPALAVAPDGNLYITWLDQRIGNGDVYLHRFSSSGIPIWTQEIRMNASDQSAQLRPAVALYKNGSPLVSWLSESGNQLYARPATPDGAVAWTDSVLVNQLNHPANPEAAPAMAPLADGVVVVWNRLADSGLYAQWLDNQGTLRWANEIRLPDVTGTTTADFRSATVTSFGEERFFTAWADQRLNRAGDIVGQLVDTRAERLWEQDRLLHQPGGAVDQELPTLAVNPDGSSIIVWRDGRGTQPQLFLQRLNADGVPQWSNNIRVDDTIVMADAQLQPDLVLHSDQTFIVWSDTRTGTARVYLQHFDAAGNRQWPTAQAVAATTGPALAQINPVIVAAQNQLYVAWEEVSEERSAILLQRLTLTGQPEWSAAVRLEIPNRTAALPAIAGDGQGNILVTWISSQGFDSDLYLHKVDANGTGRWLTPVLVNQFAGLVSRFNAPSVAGWQGEAVVVWVDKRQSGVYLQHMNADGGRLWQTDLLVNQTPGTFSPAPHVAMAPNGSTTVVWQDVAQGNFVIRGQHVSSSGQPLWNPSEGEQLVISSNSESARRPRVAIGDNGVSHIVWSDNQHDDENLYLQQVDGMGNRLWPVDRNPLTPEHFYRHQGMAQSRVFSQGAVAITQATLTADIDVNGGDFAFFLSNNGEQWENVQLGIRHHFSSTGAALQWRVVLTANAVDPTLSPVIHAVQIDYSTTPPLLDAYEPNDQCTQAPSLQVNGSAQQHSLATENAPVDIDWSKIQTRDQVNYTIVAVPNQPTIALQLQIYMDCDGAALFTQMGEPGQPVTLDWHSPAVGNYGVRISASVQESQVTARLTTVPGVTPMGYTLAVREQAKTGLAILVAGRQSADQHSQAQIDQAVTQAQRVLVDHGYASEQIKLFNATQGELSVSALRTAIEDWPVQQGLTPEMPLLIYLAGRGEQARYYLTDQISITAQQLALWLANLTARTGAQQITVVIEASRAGSFVELLAAPHRLIVSGTDEQGSCWPTSQGLLFADTFWSMLDRGLSIEQSYQQGLTAVQTAGYYCTGTTSWCQRPGLKVNGDGQGLARSLPGPYPQLGPQIQTVTITPTATANQFLLDAKLLAQDTALSVEVHLLPLIGGNPLAPTIPADGSIPMLAYSVLPLAPGAQVPAGPTLFVQHYTALFAPEPGQSYQLVIYAWDSKKRAALPTSLRYSSGAMLYLPIIAHQ